MEKQPDFIMHAADSDLGDNGPAPAPQALTRLPFPPVTRTHIQHCSVHHWYSLYRNITPKTRLIPLSPSFVSYLRADGIILPPEPGQASDSQLGYDDFSDSDEDSPDPSSQWPSVHEAVKATVHELGGCVYPKLNWSAPKDATWMAATNSMECSSANDIYLLLKSSDFITHDLEQAFSDCSDCSTSDSADVLEPNVDIVSAIPYHLALRKSVPEWIPSLEFRCFVRRRRLLAVCQRDLNHYDFLLPLVPTLQDLLYDFFTDKLKNTFPDENFVFDVYVPKPAPGGRIWLVDINPWAPRTDPLLFSWLELLTMPELPDEQEQRPDAGSMLASGVLRLDLRGEDFQRNNDGNAHTLELTPEGEVIDISSDVSTDSDSDSDDEPELLPYLPEIRLVHRDDPETYSFNTPLYSAHKLPKDVVDAGLAGEGGIRDFLQRWEWTQAEAGQEEDSSDES